MAGAEVGGLLTDVALGYLEGLLKPSKADLDAEREQKFRKGESDLASAESTRKLNEAHAAYYALGKGEGNAWRVITDPVTGAKFRYNIYTNERDDNFTGGKAAKESEAQQLLTEYHASKEPGGAPFPPAKKARLDMLYWQLLRPATESGRPPVGPWNDPSTSDPSGKVLGPSGGGGPSSTPPASTKQPPAETTQPADTPPPAAVKPPAAPAAPPAPKSTHQKRVENFTPTYEGMDDNRLANEIKKLEARQTQYGTNEITAAELEAAKGVLARRQGQQVPKEPPGTTQPGGAPGGETRPPSGRKPRISDKPYPTDTAFPKEVKPDASWQQTYETLIANRDIEESDKHWDALKNTPNMRPEVVVAYIEAYRKVHKKNPPGVIDGALPDTGAGSGAGTTTGTGTATDAGTGTVAGGGTRTAEAQPGAQQPAQPKPSDKLSPDATPSYIRNQLGEPVTSDERAAVTRKLHGQGKISGRIFTDLPPAEQDLVDAEVERPKNEQEKRDFDAATLNQKNQRLAEEAAQDKRTEPARKALAESMQKQLEELGKGAMAASKMERTFEQIEKLITSKESVYGNTGEGNAAMLLYNSPFGKTSDQRARNTSQLRNLASQLQLAFGSLGSNVSEYDARVYAMAQGNMQAAKDVPEMLQYMEVMRSVIRDVLWEHNYTRAYVEKNHTLPPWGEVKTVSEAQVQQVMKEKGKTRDQVIEALRLKRMRVE